MGTIVYVISIPLVVALLIWGAVAMWNQTHKTEIH